ncbi:MAG: PEGA domain-containing protein, partial [Planctomycetota bacterium]|nr:PEGA domain-containing protein [Planctomycetota bacterium]
MERRRRHASAAGRTWVRLIALLTGVALAGAGGCVRRVIEITSEPSGATVWLNDREVGATPCEVEIVHYGVYDVRLAKSGYEPISTGRSASAPVWDLPGPDLVAELIPANFTSRSSWNFTLVVENMSTDAVIERAIVARDRLVALGVSEPVRSDQAISRGLAEEVERADGQSVEPGEPVGGLIEPVTTPQEDVPGVP